MTAKPPFHRRRGAQNGLLVLLALCVGMAIIETALRLTTLEHPWDRRNFAVDPVNQSLTNMMIDYDPTLGYVATPYLRGPKHYTGAPGTRLNSTAQLLNADFYSHGERGIRLNKAPDAGGIDAIRQGGVLAVGDSFVYGSEVHDADAWPAVLEEMTGLPVINGSAGGYGFDQAYLRMAQLIDQAKPKYLVLGCIPNCTQRNELAVNSGLVKPYFTVKDGALELGNFPVPPYKPQRKHVGVFRYVFGNLYSLYWIFDRLHLRSAWLVYEYENQYVLPPQGAEVSCLLMKSFADLARQSEAKPILLMEYSGWQINGSDPSRETMKVPAVIQCAKSQGVTVVDSYPYLRELYQRSPAEFWESWMKQPHDTTGHSGHMSAQGNRAMAALVAAEIH
ncbi:MAG: hypothetical protein Q7R40_10685 [Phaeospirillum sp.]|nr:hypothetical protein [Phaeospirillum sp.]